jgi:rhamnosyltransferase
MKTGCILVLYNPDPDLLRKVIGSVAGQVDEVFVADNSPEPVALPLASTSVVYHRMEGNMGIAAAQNEGLKYFIGKNYDFIFFLDQDSIVESDMVAVLLSKYRALADSGVNVGAVGPRTINRQSNKKYVNSIERRVGFLSEMTEVTELTSSASLIPVVLFEEAGIMDAALFIDGVDHEWCWRAHERTGCRFFISEQTMLNHKLGEGDRQFLFRKVAIPTPFRTYYQYRNYFWLIRRKYVPLHWKLSNGLKYFVKSFYYPLCVAPRVKYLTNIARGIRDGLKGETI